MVVYEVAVEVAPERGESLRAYLAERHLPDMLGTGCFAQIVLERASAHRYRSRYVCATQADLDRYLATHADAMRADFATHFPEGARVERQTWTAVARWGEQPAS